MDFVQFCYFINSQRLSFRSAVFYFCMVRQICVSQLKTISFSIFIEDCGDREIWILKTKSSFFTKNVCNESDFFTREGVPLLKIIETGYSLILFRTRVAVPLLKMFATGYSLILIRIRVVVPLLKIFEMGYSLISLRIRVVVPLFKMLVVEH